MKKSALLFRKTERRPHGNLRPLTRDEITVRELRHYVQSWLQDGVNQSLSSNTTDLRKIVMSKLLWFLDTNEHQHCGLNELRSFMFYLQTAHTGDDGRWNLGDQQSCLKNAPRSSTVFTYWSHLCVMFKWVVAEGGMDTSPMLRVTRPKVTKDEIQPFTDEHVAAIKTCIKVGAYPKRDLAIFLLLLDTGMRASELCGLKRSDLDIPGRRAVVVGKGGKDGKSRTVVFGSSTGRSLNAYLGSEVNTLDYLTTMPLFLSDRGKNHGRALTRSGILQLFERWEERAQIKMVRCSPHTCRDTFATNFLLAGGQALTLQRLLGHEDIKMTMKYVHFVAADIENLARPFSPVDRMMRKK